MRGGPPPSVGRPCRTTTERQGVVDGTLGPANDARDGSAAQTTAGVAARDGQEGLGTTPSDCGRLTPPSATGEAWFSGSCLNRRHDPEHSAADHPL
eukprot:scaffold306_cov46-Phaeocystis_antarctica.AAC.2